MKKKEIQFILLNYCITIIIPLVATVLYATTYYTKFNLENLFDTYLLFSTGISWILGLILFGILFNWILYVIFIIKNIILYFLFNNKKWKYLYSFLISIWWIIVAYIFLKLIAWA